MMRCTFYRPANTNFDEFENIIGKLRYDLEHMNAETDELTIYYYAYHLCQKAEALEHDKNKCFWGLDDPRSMPSDARVSYFYTPSYLATAILMKAVLLHPELMDKDADLNWEWSDECISLVRKTLPLALNGCTGRGFQGSGDAASGILDVLQIFAACDVMTFLETYPDLSPEFTKLFNESFSFIEDSVEKGSLRGRWGDDYLPVAKKVMKLYQ